MATMCVNRIRAKTCHSKTLWFITMIFAFAFWFFICNALMYALIYVQMYMCLLVEWRRKLSSIPVNSFLWSIHKFKQSCYHSVSEKVSHSLCTCLSLVKIWSQMRCIDWKAKRKANTKEGQCRSYLCDALRKEEDKSELEILSGRRTYVIKAKSGKLVYWKIV